LGYVVEDPVVLIVAQITGSSYTVYSLGGRDGVHWTCVGVLLGGRWRGWDSGLYEGEGKGRGEEPGGVLICVDDS